jgi:hypothetical protein
MYRNVYRDKLGRGNAPDSLLLAVRTAAYGAPRAHHRTVLHPSRKLERGSLGRCHAVVGLA